LLISQCLATMCLDLVCLALDMAEVIDQGDHIFEKHVLQTIRQTFYWKHKTLVEMDLHLPVKDEGVGSSSPSSIAKL